jgi:hypothetical protein
MNDRRSLFHRAIPMSIDVAEAIGNLVAGDSSGLPLALTIEQITAELVRMHTIDDDGDAVILPVASLSAVSEKFAGYLMTSAVFKSGYKTYESTTRNQVVPVTAFFFKVVYTDEARDCLDMVDEYTIMKSLPGRPSQITDANGNPLEEDEYTRSGKTAGVAIFPMDHRLSGQAPKLIGSWLQRGVAITVGANDAVTNRLENAASTSARIARLKESSRTVNRDMRAALPKPRRGPGST